MVDSHSLKEDIPGSPFYRCPNCMTNNASEVVKCFGCGTRNVYFVGYDPIGRPVFNYPGFSLSATNRRLGGLQNEFRKLLYNKRKALKGLEEIEYRAKHS